MPHFIVPTSVIAIAVIAAAIVIGLIVKDFAEHIFWKALSSTMSALGKRPTARPTTDPGWEFGEYNPTCLNCGTVFPGNVPKPSCNECETCFCSVLCRIRFHRRNRLDHNYDAPLEDTASPDNHRAAFPHCDSKVLHAPGECVYCDKYPDWQAERVKKLVNFTGHMEPGKTPCPSSELRSLDKINAWSGNRPQPLDSRRFDQAGEIVDGEGRCDMGGPLRKGEGL